MITELASPMFIAGEVILGFSLIVFVGALIASIENTYRSRREW
jgi:hypothetical protein